MKIARRTKARIYCFISLYLHDIGKIPPKEILSTFIENQENIGIMSSEETRNFYNELFLTTINNIENIDKIIRESTQKPIYPIDKAIIRMATAEMLYLKNEVAVVINEAIEISKMYSPNEDKGPHFINGVLDTIAKSHILK
ncbi:MAG: transcription antitermination factor NusB [Elusimicrobiales bacterium]|nr:transcription antitermination factor NusB [Elusimicrobiales bacterium]